MTLFLCVVVLVGIFFPATIFSEGYELDRHMSTGLSNRRSLSAERLTAEPKKRNVCEFGCGSSDLVETASEINSSPCCVSTANRRIECFARVRNGSIIHSAGLFDAPSPRLDVKTLNVPCLFMFRRWKNLGENAVGSLSCYAQDAISVSVLIVDADGHLKQRTHFFKRYDDRAWTDWTQIDDDIVLEPPSMTPGVIKSEAIGVYRTTSGKLVLLRGKPGKLRRRQSTSLSVNSPIGCATNRDTGSLDCFTGDGDDRLIFISFNGTEWKSESFNFHVKGKPSVIASANRTDVIFLTKSRGIRHLIFKGGAKNISTILGWEFGPKLDCLLTSTDPFRIDCFAVKKQINCQLPNQTKSGRVCWGSYKKQYIDNKWSSAGTLLADTAFSDPPAYVHMYRNVFSCLGHTHNGEISQWIVNDC